jgi:flagellar biosynthesis anti-sigma factor FlgM
MRIDPNLRAQELPESKGPNRSGRAGQPSRSREAAPDQATFTMGAKIQQLAHAAQQLPEVRQSKVEALARAVRDGRYQVSSELIADSLFSEMLAKSVLTR